jgi:hypothetical protein
MMIPHHQGAIRMARIELEQGEDDELTELATAIIAAQSHEIEEMNSWREQWYGAPSPGGGAPPEDEEIIRPTRRWVTGNPNASSVDRGDRPGLQLGRSPHVSELPPRSMHVPPVT